MAQVGLEAVQFEPGGGVRSDEPASHPGWRPAGAIDCLGDLFAGMEILARSVRDTIRQLQEDAAADDARIALVEALVVALRTHGKAENDYAVFSSAVKVARKDEDTWEQFASAYRRYVAPGHAKVAAARGAPQVCFVRYRGSRERMAAFQLWVRVDPGQGAALWPPFVLDYPIREAPVAAQAASSGVAGSAADSSSTESAGRDDAKTAVPTGANSSEREPVSNSGRDSIGRHDRLVERLHASAALAGWTTGLVLVFALGSLLLPASLGAMDSAFGSALARVVDAVRSLVGDFSSWSIR